MRWPAIKRGGSATALAIVPVVGSLGTGTWLYLTHGPIAGITAVTLGTVTTAVVAIVKIRTNRTPRQVHAEAQAGLAQQIEDKRVAMLLKTLDEVVISKQTDAASRQDLIRLVQQLTSPVASEPAELPPPAPAELPPPAMASSESPRAPESTEGQISDEQLQRILDEDPDSNADALIDAGRSKPLSRHPSQLLAALNS